MSCDDWVYILYLLDGFPQRKASAVPLNQPLLSEVKSCFSWLLNMKASLFVKYALMCVSWSDDGREAAS